MKDVVWFVAWCIATARCQQILRVLSVIIMSKVYRQQVCVCVCVWVTVCVRVCVETCYVWTGDDLRNGVLDIVERRSEQPHHGGWHQTQHSLHWPVHVFVAVLLNGKLGLRSLPPEQHPFSPHMHTHIDTHTHTHKLSRTISVNCYTATGPWQLQPEVAQIRVHNNLPTRH